MSNRLNKRYFWLKLPRGFFKRHDIQIIEGMPNGKDYVLFYMKLLCESIDHEGRLRFSEEIPYTADMLAIITRTNIDTAKTAMELLCQLGLMEIEDDGTIFMTELPDMVGSETGMAQYMRQRRLEMKKDVVLLGEFSNVQMTTDEVVQLKEFYPSYWAEYVDKLSAHKKSTGREYASDYATIKKWLTDDIGLIEEV